MKYTKVIIFFLIVTYFFIGCGAFSEDEIRAKIDSTIPVGSPKKDVIQFLNANSFTYATNPKNGGLPTDCGECEWMKASRYQWVLWRKGYITVDLFFDQQNDSLLKYRVSTSYPATSF